MDTEELRASDPNSVPFFNRLAYMPLRMSSQDKGMVEPQ